METLVAATFGACIGSFLGVCGERIPDGTFWASWRSRCDHCQQGIPPWLNIPLLGYLLLRGRARCCGGVIPWRYPAIELASAIVTVICWRLFPFVSQIAPWEGFYLPAFIRFAHALTFSYLLVLCSFIDLKLMIIPDKISLPMIAATPLWVWCHPELDARSALIGVVAGGGVIYGIAWIYYLLRRAEGIGMGDAKLLAAIGGWLGYQGVFPTILYGSILGSVCGILAMVVRRKADLRLELPFGPFLAVGALLHLLGKWHFETLFLLP